jgi:dehydrodolichyl diphosphate syntase complex subunit NUS1
MDLLPALILRVLHFLYALTSLARSLWRRQTRPYPRSLRSPRQKLPENLAVVFVIDTNIPPDIVRKTLFESLSNLVEWCRIVGIPRLIIYEEHGSNLSPPDHPT